MPLRTRVIDIPLGVGVDEKTASKLIEPPAFTTVENAEILKTGRFSKRKGFGTSFSASDGDPDLGATIDDVHTISAGVSSILALHSPTSHYIWSSPVGEWTLPSPSASTGNVEVHPASVAQISGRVFDAAGVSPSGVDLAVNNDGIACMVWGPEEGFVPTSEAFEWVVFDPDTGEVIAGPAQVSRTGSYCGPAVATDGTNFYVCVGDTDISPAILVYSMIIAFQGYDWDSGTSVSGSVGSGIYHVASASDVGDQTAAYFMFAGPGNPGSDGLLAIKADSSGVTADTVSTSLSLHDPVGIGAYVDEANQNLWYSYVNTSGTLKLGARSTVDLSASVSEGTIETGIGAPRAQTGISGGAGSEDVTVWWEDTDAPSVGVREARDSSGTATPEGTGATVHHNLRMVSLPWLAGGRSFCALAYSVESGTDPDAPAGIIGGFSASKFVSRFIYAAGRFGVDAITDSLRTSGFTTPHYSDPYCHAISIDTGYMFATPALLGSTRDRVVRQTIVSFDGQPLPRDSYEGVTYFAGGMLQAWDGQHLQEHAPHFRPQITSAKTSGSGGGLSAGAYQYVAVAEWEDARGNLRRSPPSLPVTVTATSGQNGVLDVTLQPVAARDDVRLPGYRIDLYRTRADGTTFFRVDEANAVAGSTNISREGTATSTAVTTLTDDTATDSGLGAALYTGGGVLANQAPPPCHDLAFARGRMWLIDAENRRRLRYSKFLQVTIAPEFPAEFAYDLPEEAEAIKDIGDGLLVLGREDLFVVYGEGPTDTGVNNDFSAPQRLGVEFGCSNRNSVARGSFGVVYQSERGIELFRGGGQVEYIGAPVEDSLGSKAVRRAIIQERWNRVIFVTDDNALVWNYLYNAWAVWSSGPVFQSATKDADQFGASKNLLVANGDAGIQTFYEQTTAAGDGDTYVVQTLRTGWIRLTGIQGFQRVRKIHLLGSSEGAHNLTVNLYYDYESNVGNSFSFTNAETSTLEPYQLSIHVPRQKCQAISVEVLDSESSGNTAGFALDSISLEVGVKGDLFRSPGVEK